MNQGRKCIAKGIAALLVAALLLPSGLAFARPASAEGICRLDDGYLEIRVNQKNGGFHIATVLGDKLNKDDNNKDLLYPTGDYDTSFTTLRVTRGGVTKDYVFGGRYEEGGNPVLVTEDETGVTAVWSVDGFTVIQRLELEALESRNHGMARIAYQVANTGGEEADAELRILLDTALGSQDYAYYEVLRPDGPGYDQVTREATLSSAAYGDVFFAYDDPNLPLITSYVLRLGSQSYKDPSRVTFGHWNNLASSAFDYVADPSLTFTNPNNAKYLTADSAFALYYDLGHIAPGGSAAAGTIYGVYSNVQTDPEEARVTVNVTGPDSLTLSNDKKAYLDGTFQITALLQNFSAAYAVPLSRVALAVRTPDGVFVMVNGEVNKNYTYKDPYTIKYEEFLVGQTRTSTIDLQAEVRSQAQYRKVILDVYDVGTPDAAGGQLLAQNQIGSAEYYLYCPGGEEDLPEVSVISGSPNMLYCQGTRYFYMAGAGFGTLQSQLNAAKRTIVLRRVDGLASYDVEKDCLNINANDNTASLLVNLALPIGQYQVVLKAADGSGLVDIAGPALQFAVTDDSAFRNTTYGLVVVTKTGNPPVYNIEVYETESAYKAKYGSGSPEALLVLRGEFTAEKDASGKICLVEGASTSKTDNVMTLNNCIDIQEGMVQIRKDGGVVKVDFDAKLYTTGARSSVWRGSCCLTGLRDGEDYVLIPYGHDGDRLLGESLGGYSVGPLSKPITLIWGCAGGRGLQALAGMLLNMEFGNLGVQLDGETEVRRVVSFGAQLDLGFLFPDPSQLGGGDASDTSGIADYLSLLVDLAAAIPDLADAPADTLRELFESTVNTIMYGGKPDDDGVTVAVKVPDVIFGGAFLGFICSAEVKLPSYVEGFPEIEGKLDIRTVGDWSMAVAGKVSFTSMTLEADLAIKSYKGIPVPDKFYIFVGGFTPGLNVDGFGVLWLMGGGGGIDELYDTLFSPGTLPPLTLLLSVQASILQVFEARADLSLSLRGIHLTLSNGKIMQVKVINTMRLELDWYPEFHFLASVNLDILGAIKGAGYIVVESDGFFEFAAMASVSVPDDVPVFGGLEVAKVGLGANARRIYGTVGVLCTNLGIVYYWGGDFEFGSTDDIGAGPTYPELLMGLSGSPVCTDPETGKPLYLYVGTNLTPAASQAVKGDDALELMAVGHKILSSIDLDEHELRLGEYDADHLLILSYTAEDAQEGRTILDQMDFGDMDLTFYPEDGANAHYHWHDGKATVVVSFTETLEYEKTYGIRSGVPAELVLLKVADLPQVSKVNYSKVDGTVTVTGQHLDIFDSVSFLAVNEANPEDIYLVGKATGISAEEASSFSRILSLPENLPTGDYFIQATGTLSGFSSDVKVTAAAFHHVNAIQPGTPSVSDIRGVGDGMVRVVLAQGADCDGYIVNVYDGDVPTELRGLTFAADEDILLYGGKYTVPVFLTDADGALVLDGGSPIPIGTREAGLSYGKEYVVGVSAYKIHDEVMHVSGEAYEDVIFSGPTKTSLCVTSEPAQVFLLVDRGTEPYDMPHITASDVVFTAISPDETFEGTWSVDGDQVGFVAAPILETSIQLLGLAEGEHLLEFSGKDETLDNVSLVYPFVVDTLGPRLLLECPQSGSFFEADGSLVVKGVADPQTRITIWSECNATTPLHDAHPVEIDGEGRFTLTVNLPKNHNYHKLTIVATDPIGNKVEAERTVYNGALGNVDAWRLYAGDVDITDANLMDGLTGDLSDAPLTLRGKVSGSTQSRGALLEYDLILDDPSLVSFEVAAHRGSAWVDEDNRLSVQHGSAGIVYGGILVSDTQRRQVSAFFNSTPVDPDPEPEPDPGSDTDFEPYTPPQTLLGLPEGLPLPSHPFRDIDVVQALAGESASYPLPQGVDPNRVIVVYTSVYGETTVLPLSVVTDGRLVFRAPFKGTYRIVESAVDFDDTKGHWATADILYLAARGLFVGTGEGEFSPDVTLSRAMVVTVLGRLMGASVDSLESPFDDVPSDTWYTGYVAWAKAEGIVAGTSDVAFEPEREVTREELCTILYRCLVRLGIETAGEELAFSDSDQVSEWAIRALQASVGAGLIVGYDNEVRPADSTLRSEGAAILARLIRMLSSVAGK